MRATVPLDSRVWGCWSGSSRILAMIHRIRRIETQPRHGCNRQAAASLLAWSQYSNLTGEAPQRHHECPSSPADTTEGTQHMTHTRKRLLAAAATLAIGALAFTA